MPQKLDLQPYDITSGQLDLQPYSTPSKPPPEEQHWYDNIFNVPTALRTIGTLGGGAIGTLADEFLGPFGTIGGAAIGSGLGETAAQWYEGKGYNPGLIATETALGAIPGFGELPGKGAGIGAIGKYALGQAGQGAVQGAVGSVPRHIAETGQWEMPSPGEVAGQTIGGAGFGAAFGLGHGAYGHFMNAPKPAEPPPDFTKQPTMADMAPPGMPPSVQPPPLAKPLNSFEQAMRAKGATTPEDMAPGPMGEHEVAATDQIPVPKQNVNPQFIEKMAQGGYTESHRDNNFVYFQQGPDEPAFAQSGPPNSGEQSELKDSRRSPLSPDQYNDPTAKRWAAIVHELDSQNARDMDYSEILSTSTKNRLRKGETWRSRVVDGIDYLENLHKEFNPSLEIPSDEPSFQKQPRELSQMAYDPSRDPTGWLPDQGSTIPQNAGNEMAARAREMKQQQDEAYRAGDTRRAVDLGQQIDELESLIGRTGTRDINRLRSLGDVGISEARGPRSYQDLTPERYKRYTVLDENDNVIHKTYDSNEAQRIADDQNGYVQDSGPEPGISEMADPKRPYDPTVGGDALQRQQGTWTDALETADEQELKQMGRALQADLLNMKYRIQQNGGYAPGSDKRRMLLTERKMAEIDQAIISKQQADRREPSNMGLFSNKPPDETIQMEIGGREEILRNMQGTYAEHGGRVANKELLQNALDATPTGGTVHVNVNHQNGYLTVTDNGPGLPIDMIRNEYITLTGSGKRGVGAASGRKSIGEMGVGKATYLLGVDKFEVHTIAKEPDGTTWKYEFSGTPDNMIGKDLQGNDVPKVAIKKTQMPDGTLTGTEVTVHDKDPDNIKAAEDYLKTFADYSDSPVRVVMTADKRPGSYSWEHPFNKTVDPRTTTVGQHVSSGSGPGGDFQIFVPTGANWDDRGYATAIITSRGMFQGVDTVNLGGRGKLPDRIVVNVDPTVSAQNAKLYPLTSPTRERMKDPFKNVIEEQIKEHLTKAAEKARQDDLKAAYAALQPDINPRNGQPYDFVVHDSGDRYTPDERAKLVNSPRMQAVAGTMKQMLDKLNRLFPTQQSGGKTHKYGFLIDGDNKGGMNVPDLIIRDNNAVLVNPFSAIQRADTPQIAAARLMHITAHEFNHNIERSEGGRFTWSFADVLSKLTPEEQVAYKNAFARSITDSSGNYSPEIQDLLHDYTTARGRADTSIDLLTRSTEGRFAQSPGSEGVPSSGESDGERTTSEAVGPPNQPPPPNTPPSGGGPKDERNWFQRNLGWGQGASKGGSRTQKDEVNWVKEALSVPAAATTTGDLSYPGRQGLSMIFTPQFWDAAGKMFKGGLSQKTFDQMNADLANKPLMRKRVNLKTGQVSESLGQELGLKIYKLASQAGPHAEGISSRWLERGIGKTTVDPQGNKFWQPTTGSKAWANTVGVPIRASNRAFLTMMNHLSVNRTEFLMNKARDMSVGALKTGEARPGLFNQKYGQQEAMDLNPYHNKVLAKEIVDFVNTATGHAPLKMHILPAKQTEVSLEGASKVLSSVLFSPGQLFSRMRMMNPSTYIMASPYVRKQYLKSALSTAAAWYAFTEMAKMAGGDKVQVSNDPTSADFGKVRIGDARLDPGGGFLQFLVAYGRLYAGGATSSSTGQFHRFGEGYQAQTSEDMMQRFMVNKLNPNAKFAYDLLSASQYNPFHVGDRTAQMFVPLIAQDLLEIGKEDPTLLPTMGTAATFGMGTQIYSKGESVGKIIPPQNDWLVTGGGVRDLWGGGNQ